MSKPLSIKQVASWFLVFGVSDVIQRLNTAKSVHEANTILDSCKTEAKKTYKLKAVKLHPDKNNNSDTEFKEVTNIWNNIKNLKINSLPQPLQPLRSPTMMLRIYYGCGCTSIRTYTSNII